jgi:CheY-like chemotaxis protein
MDIQMPEIDGYETARLIRSYLSGENQPVILAMTADAVNDLEEKCKEYGLDGIILKPVTEESLVERFSQHNLVTVST